MICQRFLSPSQINSKRLAQPYANRSPTVRGAAQHGAEFKLLSSPGLTTKVMPPGS